MAWYTASLILALKLRNGKQEIFPVYENYVLIEADSPKAAFEKADAIGIAESKADDTWRIAGEPADWIYMGVRKMMEIHHTSLLSPDKLEVECPYSGVEVSYSYLEVDSEEQLNRLAEGKAVMVHLIDMDDLEGAG